MKILTLNFLTCARKACKGQPAAFPLHPRDAELEVVELDLSPEFIRNVLPRVEWDALRGLCGELGLPALPEQAPTASDLFTTQLTTESDTMTDDSEKRPSQTLRDLHTVLMETTITTGRLVCGNCEHEYAIKEGIANFLLPAHMV